MALAIEFSPEAEHMLEAAEARWASGHEVSDNPLLDQIARAADLLRENPELGVVYRRGGFRRETRRLLLRSGWHLYYSYERARSTIVIVAVWYARRGSGPPL